jgi:NADH:ubiquinone oxidoreductase subunit 4 (subunit M)
MILRALHAVGWCFIIAASIVVICVMARRGSPGGAPVVEYKDFVSILLTALGVMIALGAVLAALAAIYGFETIRKEAVHAAEQTAARVAESKVNEIVPRLVEQVAKIDREVSGTQADQIAEEIDKEE